MVHHISRTRGPGGVARDFFWYISNDKLIIQKISSDRNADGRLYIGNNWANQGKRCFTKDEISAALYWLLGRFGGADFPLANNVEQLRNGAEIDGFGVALYRVNRNVYYAQGSSYLGVVLEHFGILIFVRTAPTIAWRFADSYAAPYHNAASIADRVNECFTTGN
ncbi:hypothetical protein [Methylovulum psychrotolerans]|uniref:Uncharacterized protein n=1 Tax=Methylovulum psychrotolerans TaxID=1704499 RepID=A0A2S5CLQ2_9GAMM|nr:hypothetical protein [Methylovulum psychrotolerans]POZ51708.1 hypothetical protein AADEFJLK_02578 [Methylovulum psychrotolerans]